MTSQNSSIGVTPNAGVSRTFRISKEGSPIVTTRCYILEPVDAPGKFVVEISSVSHGTRCMELTENEKAIIGSMCNLREDFNSAVDNFPTDINSAYWRHDVACASIAKRFAKMCHKTDLKFELHESCSGTSEK